MKQIALSVSILSCCICGCGHAQNKSDDHIVMVKSADLEMNSAIQEARASLPKFWSAFNSNAPHLEDFALKVAIHDGEKTEHFWINNIQKSDGKLFGFIANDPELVTTVKFGQRVEIPITDITDWKYIKEGKLIGGFTIAVLLKRVPKAESDAIKKQIGW